MWGWTRGGAGEGFRPGRCNLLFGGFSVGTDGEGAAGIAGAGAGGAGLVGIVVVAFLSSFFFESLLFLSFPWPFGCNSGMEILLRWTVRFLGGVYLSLGSSLRLILFGPFLVSCVS